MERSPSREAVNFTFAQELLNILWNPKVCHRLHNSLPLLPIQSPLMPIYLSRSNLILSCHLHLDLPSDLFPSGFPNKILYSFIFSSFVLNALLISPPPLLLDHSNYIWRRVKLMEFLDGICCLPFAHSELINSVILIL
jgi:hypothetical protein